MILDFNVESFTAEWLITADREKLFDFRVNKKRLCRSRHVFCVSVVLWCCSTAFVSGVDQLGLTDTFLTGLIHYWKMFDTAVLKMLVKTRYNPPHAESPSLVQTRGNLNLAKLMPAYCSMCHTDLEREPVKKQDEKNTVFPPHSWEQWSPLCWAFHTHVRSLTGHLFYSHLVGLTKQNKHLFESCTT